MAEGNWVLIKEKKIHVQVYNGAILVLCHVSKLSVDKESALESCCKSACIADIQPQAELVIKD